MLYARTKKDPLTKESLPKSEWQKLDDHSDNVSKLASQFGSKAGITEIMRLGGFWHDYGKASLEFQKYLCDKNAKKPFCVSMLTKFAYSCLVDADRLDAYLFESGMMKMSGRIGVGI